MVKEDTEFGPIFMLNSSEMGLFKDMMPFLGEPTILNYNKQSNMEKKYKLIKEIQIPGKGNVDWLQHIKVGDVKTIGEWSKLIPHLLGYHLTDTEWFELVEEKEFTRTDMERFAVWYKNNYNGSFVSCYMKEYVDHWIKNIKK